MFPRGPLSAWRKAEAEKRHSRAEQICKEQGLFLSEVAPDEFAKVEQLRYPGRDTMQELKRAKQIRVFAGVMIVLAVLVAMLFFLAALTTNIWGGG